MIDWEKVPGLVEELEEVDSCMARTLQSKQKFLTTTLEELMQAGGKRLRPVLLLLSGRFGDYQAEKLIPLAAIIEILHMATLVHDDIIDDARLRRGHRTVQSRWGKDIAVFTGDFLFSNAFFLLTQNASFEYLQKAAMAIRKICEGEIDQYYSRYDIHITLKQYLKRISFKTAILFALSCQIGAQESKCQPRDEWHLQNIGGNLGMAFQITDDILNFQGQESIVGKPVGNDLVQGVYTLPLVYSLSRAEYRLELEGLLAKSIYEQEDISHIIDIVVDSGGITFSQKIVKRYHDKALKHIRALQESPARLMLEEMVEELTLRQY